MVLVIPHFKKHIKTPILGFHGISKSFTFRLTKCSITQAGPPNAVLARVVNSAKSQEIGLSEPLQDLREGKPYKTASLCLVQSPQKVTMLRNFWAMFHGFFSRDIYYSHVPPKPCCSISEVRAQVAFVQCSLQFLKSWWLQLTSALLTQGCP